MSQRVKIKCGTCGQAMAVDPAHAGKQVQCPKCQTLLVIPSLKPRGGPSETGSKQTAAPKQAGRPGQQGAPVRDSSPPVEKPKSKLIVVCSNCGMKMSVKPRATAARASCPKCQSSIPIPAAPGLVRSPASDGNPTPVRPTNVTSPGTSSARPAATAVGESTEPIVEGHLADGGDLFSGSGFADAAVGLGLPPAAGTPLASSRPTSASRPQANGLQTLLRWCGQNPLICVIVILNLLLLIGAMIDTERLRLSAISLCIGAVICGLLLVPRKHLVRQLSKRFNLGLIFVLGLVGTCAAMLGIVHLVPEFELRVDNAFKICLMLVICFFVAGMFLWMWYGIGMARSLATVYLLPFSLITLGMYLSLAVETAEERERSRTFAEMEAEMDRWKGSPDFPSAPTMPGSRTELPPGMPRPHNIPQPSSGTAGSSRPSGTTRQSRAADAAESSRPTNTANNRTDQLAAAAKSTLPPSADAKLRKSYRVSIAVPHDSEFVPADLKIKAGVKLQACYAGKWNPITALSENSDGTLNVRWDDYGSSFDCSMLRGELIIRKAMAQALRTNPDSVAASTPPLRRKNYAVSIPVPGDSEFVPADAVLNPRTKLQACNARKWNPITFLSHASDGTLNVRWDDYGAAFDCSMVRNELIIKKAVLMTMASGSSAAEMRTFTDATGKSKIKARIVKQTSTEVTLFTEKGKEVTLPLAKLSEADQAFLRSATTAENPIE